MHVDSKYNNYGYNILQVAVTEPRWSDVLFDEVATVKQNKHTAL